jgi:hypothetical protein
MALAMEQDETVYPMDIGLFRPDAIVLDTQPAAHLVQQPGFGGRLMGEGMLG